MQIINSNYLLTIVVYYAYIMRIICAYKIINKEVKITMNLKWIRQYRGLTQQRLAALSGVSYALIQRYESDYEEINRASVATIYKLAQALGCSINSLMGWKQLEELIIERGSKEYTAYLNSNGNTGNYKAMLNVYLYRKFRKYKDVVNLDVMTNKIIRLCEFE